MVFINLSLIINCQFSSSHSANSFTLIKKDNIPIPSLASIHLPRISDALFHGFGSLNSNGYCMAFFVLFVFSLMFVLRILLNIKWLPNSPTIYSLTSLPFWHYSVKMSRNNSWARLLTGPTIFYLQWLLSGFWRLNRTITNNIHLRNLLLCSTLKKRTCISLFMDIIII